MRKKKIENLLDYSEKKIVTETHNVVCVIASQIQREKKQQQTLLITGK